MREAEKKQFNEEERFRRIVKDAQKAWGETRVKSSVDAEGNMTLVISRGGKTVVRKEHSFKECERISGD